jgi:hypothetical protein
VYMSTLLGKGLRQRYMERHDQPTKQQPGVGEQPYYTIAHRQCTKLLNELDRVLSSRAGFERRKCYKYLAQYFVYAERAWHVTWCMVDDQSTSECERVYVISIQYHRLKHLVASFTKSVSRLPLSFAKQRAIQK